MAVEDDFVTRMEADAPLMAILTGGVYASSELGPEGITRDSAASAFDANGYLKPCALVKQRGNIPDGVVSDDMVPVDSAAQVVEIWCYQDRGYSSIDSALARCYTLFRGHIFTNSFPARLANVLDRQRDTGALNGASVARQDWQVHNIV